MMTMRRDDCTFSRFEEACREHPATTALIYLGDSFSYARLGDLTSRFATGLHGIGVKTGERVMLYIPNCPQWIIANFAVNMIGAVVVPVSPIYTTYEIEHIMGDAGVRTVICLDTNFAYVKEAATRADVERIVVTGIADLVAPWKRLMGHLLDRIPRGRVERGEKVHLFGDVVSGSGPEPPRVEIDPSSDLATIMYTGGTTGLPRGIPGAHASEVSYIRDMMEDVFKGHILESGDVVIMASPLFHIMAKGFTLGAGLNGGNTVVLMPYPEIDPILHAIENHGVRWLLGVPALYRMILESDRLDEYELSSLKYCFCGGDVLPTEVSRSWNERFGIPIYQVYGSTEVGHVSYSPLDSDPGPGIVGRPLESRRCLAIDPQTLQPLPPGQVGELVVSSEFVLERYWNNPEETARSHIEIEGETYYRTGDFVIIHEDGQLEFIERTADIIKYKGYRVSASEIEAVLQNHPAVIGACTVGVPDATVGERIKAIVVLKHDTKGVGGPELIRWCRERLAPYKIPAYVEFRDMLPRSKVGKLLRREIREEERRKSDADPRCTDIP